MVDVNTKSEGNAMPVRVPGLFIPASNMLCRAYASW